LQSDDSEQWLSAIQLETDAMHQHQALEFMPDGTVDNARIIPRKWVLSLKLNADGSANEWKARLVGRGDRQVAGRDFGDITSPVVDSTTIRLILGLAAHHDYEIVTLDVPIAFLGCPLTEDIYMRLPHGQWGSHDPLNRERPLVKLRKTLYGIRQAN
jgi:hypothetical protein